MIRLAIQGEPGSNSHMAALAVAEEAVLVPCGVSAEVFEALSEGRADGAVLPIENSLHGAVFEHYDLLLEGGAAGPKIVGETLLRIRHNVIAAPGVRLEELRQVSSHPVALSQCRRWLRAHPGLQVRSANDTAGSVRELMASGERTAGALAPELAARLYGAQVLVAGVEDHAENYTRFLLLAPAGATGGWHPDQAGPPNKMSLALTLPHRPGSLVDALEVFRRLGMNLTKIESRPVQGRPWEYVFFLDVRFDQPEQADEALAGLAGRCERIEVLGRYPAAQPPV